MNICPKCGSDVNVGENFCRVCGTKVADTTNQNINNQVGENPSIINTQNITTPNMIDNNINDTNPFVNQNNTITNQTMNNNLNMNSNQNMYSNLNIDNYNNLNTNNNQNPSNNQSINNSAINNSTINNENNDVDEDLLLAYIGKNADKLQSGFSFCAFFLGIVYVFYRKMWLLGCLWLFINFFAGMFLPSLSFFINLAVAIIMGTEFKKLYIKNAKEQIDKTRREHPDKQKDYIKMLCTQKGGTTIIPVIIASILLGLVLLALIVMIIIIASVYQGFKASATVSTVTLDNLNITLPNHFEVVSEKENYKMYQTTNNGDSCSISIKEVNASIYNNDSKDYLEKNIFFTSSDAYSGIGVQNINNNSWHYAGVKTDNTEEYYYSGYHNGKIYEVDYIIRSDVNKTCSDAYDSIFSSLRFN